MIDNNHFNSKNIQFDIVNLSHFHCQLLTELPVETIYEEAKMPEFNFENIENILNEYLGGKHPITKLQEFKLSETSGDHLRKLILTVKGKRTIGKDVVDIEVVAKLLPEVETDSSKIALKKEIDFYKFVLPRLQAFQLLNKNDDVFNGCPEYVGSRLNLNGDKEIGPDAALLLQNLWEAGKMIYDVTINY